VGGLGRVKHSSGQTVLSPVAMLVASPEAVLILNKGNMFIVLGTRKHKCIVADLCDALVHLLVINLTYLHVVVDISVHCLDYCIWIVSCSLSRLVAMCSVAHQIGRLHGQVCGCLRKVSCTAYCYW